MTLEIGGGNFTKHACKPIGRIAVFRQIGGAQQRFADFRTGCCGHLLDTHHQSDFGSARSNGFERLMHRRRTGGAGILNPRGGFEAQSV